MCLLSLQYINAANITVSPGGSIQNAINDASNGDNVTVYGYGNNSGYTYTESVTLNKEINIKAVGNVTIQDPTTSNPVFTITPSGSGSSIQDFTMTKSSYCVVIENANNCIISGNNIVAASLVGIQFYGNVNNNKVVKNNITGLNNNVGNGISFEYGSSTYNTIWDNKISNFLGGILFNSNSAHDTISSNIVYCSNYQGAGIYATDDSRYMIVVENKVTGARDGIAVQQIGSSVANNYIISNNTVESNVNGFWIRLTKSVISANFASLNKASGLDVTGSYNKIINNISTKNSLCGIAMGKYSAKDYNTVTGNILTYNIAGINSESNYSTICDNYVTHNTNNGIISTANHVTITGNTINTTADRLCISGSSNNIHN